MKSLIVALLLVGSVARAEDSRSAYCQVVGDLAQQAWDLQVQMTLTNQGYANIPKYSAQMQTFLRSLPQFVKLAEKQTNEDRCPNVTEFQEKLIAAWIHTTTGAQ